MDIGIDMGFWGTSISTLSIPTDPADTDRSTVETIQQMIALARSSAMSPNICSIVDTCLYSLPKKPTKKDLVRAIYYWVKNHVRFVEDEETLTSKMGQTDPYQELLISPDVLVSMPNPQGDCDDFSMLVASLMICAGVPVWFKAVAIDPDMPWKWSHIYCKVWLDDSREFVNLDASHGSKIGWETERQKYRVMEWKVN